MPLRYATLTRRLLRLREQLPPAGILPEYRQDVSVEDSCAAPGRVEVCSRDFLCGWIEDYEATHLDIVINDTRLEAHTLFSDGALLDPRSGARRRHFVTCLAGALELGDRVAVKLGGRDLAGSPAVIAAARPPAESERANLRFHVEAPSGPIENCLCTVSGWATFHAGAYDLRLLVNGDPQNAFFTVRPDVVDYFEALAVGWQFTCDVAALEAKGAVALRIVCELDGQVVGERDIELRLARRPRPPPPLYLMMHVPKTAGTSLNAAIALQPTLATHWLYHRGPFSVSTQVAALSARAFRDLDLVGGHFTFGIHQGVERPCRYMAVLREPLEYLRSYFFFRKDVQRFPPFRDLDAAEAIERRLDHLLDNCFTRFFTGMPAERPVDAPALAEAVSNMERHFAFVGVVERMNESVERLSELLGVSLDVGRDNITPLSTEAREFDMAAFALRAEPFVRYDEQLYRHALKLFWT